MSRKPSKPETRIEDYLDVMTGGNAALPQPILRIEFYYAFLAGMTVELPQPILDDEKLLAKICGSTTLDVETTVPPSEVYIKYRGEAVATLSSLPAEVSSPEAATEEVNPEETEEEENER